MAYRVRNRIRVVFWAGFVVTSLLCLYPRVAFAQYGRTPGDLVDTFRALRPNWFTAASGAANRLFGLLALIEFAWTAVLLVLDKSDLHGWTAALIRRMMFVGAFMALLVNGPLWIPAIIDSFAIIGQNAAGIGGPGLSPGDVFLRGLDIAGNLGLSASKAGFFANAASALALVLAAILTFLSFVIVSVHFIMALVESYVVVGAGFIFLGFGGSRWTAPYVERYIALAVAVGVKLMVLYMLIGAGMTLSGAWTARALTAALAPSPIMEALDIMGGAIIFGILCWQAPKFTASLLGGSPAFSGGDIAAMGFAGAQAGIAVATLGAGAAKILAARGAAAGGAMTVNQAAGMGAGGSGGARMSGASSAASAASGGQAGGAAGSGGNSNGGGGNKGSGGSGGSNGQNGGIGAGSDGVQPKPPTLGGGGGSSGGGGNSQTESRNSSNESAGPRASNSGGGVAGTVSAGTAGGSEAIDGRSSGQQPSPATRAAEPGRVTPTRSGTSGIATPVEPGRNAVPPAIPSRGATNEPLDALTADSNAFAGGSMDVVSGVGGAVGSVGVPAISGGAADPTFESPQTITNPQAVGAPMRNTSLMTIGMSGNQVEPTQSNVIPANFGSRPAGQPAPPPIPGENGTLENPQTVSGPQTVTSPMANTSPMTAKSSGLEKVAKAANVAEQALTRSGRFTQGLRQSLPSEGSGGGGPAQLNLHGGE